MPDRLGPWLPAAILMAGIILLEGIQRQHRMELAHPLEEAIPTTLSGFDGEDIELSEAEARAAGVDDYLMRLYQGDTPQPVSVYIGYYEQQTQGHTIHSPKNCLPGGGWEPLQSQSALIGTTRGDSVSVNRYRLRRADEQVLVLYWYQGRGRIASNEYVVKWDLLRDAALRGRSEEALVRIVVPITDGETAAFELAKRFAAMLIPALSLALPT